MEKGTQMTSQKENIKTLFERAKPLVPMYERGYNEHWHQRCDDFLDELREIAKGSKNPYFLGIIVLYKPSKNAKTTSLWVAKTRHCSDFCTCIA